MSSVNAALTTILTHALGHRERLHSTMPNVFELSLLPEDRWEVRLSPGICMTNEP
jgi:hypothetical protein